MKTETLFTERTTKKVRHDYGMAGRPLVVCEVVCKLEGKGLMLNDSMFESQLKNPLKNI